MGWMQKKLTITLNEEVYEGLHRVIGRGSISRFIENLVRPHVVEMELEAGYAAMAADEEHEAEALEWIEGVLDDFDDEDGNDVER
jgi:predicted CopG family antitoxin